eukprot:2593670-Amphidinium_carterae.1
MYLGQAVRTFDLGTTSATSDLHDCTSGADKDPPVLMALIVLLPVGQVVASVRDLHLRTTLLKQFTTGTNCNANLWDSWEVWCCGKGYMKSANGEEG